MRVCLIGLAALALLTLGSACSTGAGEHQDTATNTGVLAATTGGTAQKIKVIYNGETLAELSTAQISKLKQQTVKVNDTTRTGATLTDLVTLAGLKEFGGALVCGYIRDNAEEASFELGGFELVSEIIMPLDGGSMAIFGPAIDSKYWNMRITQLIITPCDSCGV